MNSMDPFQALGSERTLIKPRLGKPLGPSPAGGPAAVFAWESKAPSDASLQDVQFDSLLQAYKACPPVSRNRLVNEAGPLMRLGVKIGSLNQLNNPGTLSGVLTRALQDLEQALLSCQRPQTERLALRYILCTFLDERAANTPWGGSGQWAPHSLLLHFFSETWGGEKVFQLLQKMIQSPAENHDLLELMAILLSLGFQGKYKVEIGGQQALDQLRIRLFQLVSPAASGSFKPLHPEFWRSTAALGKPAFLTIPLWLPFTALCILAALVFTLLAFNMNTRSDHAFDQLAGLSLPHIRLADRPLQDNSAQLGLQLPVQLQQEILKGQLTLQQKGNRSTVILVGDGLFDSGSAELVPRAVVLVEKVARALAMHPGAITVTGYTDNQPIRSVRFPSNWQLSAARAAHVGQRIEALLPNVLVHTEGAGAANPIAPNDTAQGRSRNRRVEITLLHSH